MDTKVVDQLIEEVKSIEINDNEKIDDTNIDKLIDQLNVFKQMIGDEDISDKIEEIMSYYFIYIHQSGDKALTTMEQIYELSDKLFNIYDGMTIDE